MTQTMPETMHTVSTLTDVLRDCGLQPGMTLLMHSSLSKVGGWICGGAEAMIQAVLTVLGENGTLMMPAHSNDNSDPALWQNPPVPEAWWETIRDEMPPFNPATTRTRQMGILVETFRTFPGVQRSNHPQFSFVAKGKHADTLLNNHSLENGLDESSPLARLYDLKGHVFLMGVGHGNNTSLHLAEHRADFPDKDIEKQGAAMLIDGQRYWVTFEMLNYDEDDFERLGAAFMQAQPEQTTRGHIGNAETLLFRQQSAVDFAVKWMETHRTQTDRKTE